MFLKLLPLIVFASGASALVVQSLWTRSLSLVLGSSTQAASLVLAAFMAGLGWGAWLLRARRIKRLLPAYAAVELGMGLAVLAGMGLMRLLPPALAVLVVLPQALLAGASMPLLTELVVRAGGRLHPQFARLYRLNTLGAAFGVWAGAFVLVPRLGLARTALAAAAVNVLLAGLAWMGRGGEPAEAAAVEEAKPGPLEKLFPWLALGSGALGMLLELLWMRTLSLVIGSSVYAFNLMLLAVLLGLVLGTWIYERLYPRLQDTYAWLRALCLLLALLLPLQVLLLGWLPAMYLGLSKGLPTGFAAHQWAGFLLCFLALLMLTAPLGALFPLLSHALSSRSHAPQSIAARLYAFNTLGAVLGALAAGFLLIPQLGLQASFSLALALPLGMALGVWSLNKSWSRGAKLGLAGACLALAAGMAAFFRPWNPLVMSSGPYLSRLEDDGQGEGLGAALGRMFSTPAQLPSALAARMRLLYYKEDAEAVVAVRKSLEDGVTSLVINGKADASDGSDLATQKLLAHLPLILHPGAKRAAVIGWGSGCTAGTAGLYPLERLDCVELVPATLEAAPHFASLQRGILKDPRFHLAIGDGRNFLLGTGGHKARPYDVISSEPPNPWITGVANLFTSDFYALASKRLAPGGLFSQFFHYYSMEEAGLKAQLRTFCLAFPHASAWFVPAQRRNFSGDMILLGSHQPIVLDPGRFRAALALPGVAEDLKSFGGEEELSFFCNYALGRDEMLAYAGPGPANSDDRPLIEFSSPRTLNRSMQERQQSNRALFLAMDLASSSLHPPLSALPAGPAAAYASMGMHYLDKAMPHKALRLLEASAALKPLPPAALARLGEAYYIAGCLAEAVPKLQQALARDPGLRDAYAVLGKVLQRLQDIQGSRAVFQRMADRFPNDAQGWYGVAANEMLLGNRPRAAALARKALELEPTLEDAARLLKHASGMM